MGKQAVVNDDALWKALADPIRRRLLWTLAQRQHFCHVDGQQVDGVCVQDLSAILQLPQSTVSRHLTVLRQAGLVVHTQRGVWHYYGCRTPTLRAASGWLDALCSLKEAGGNSPPGA